MYSTIARTLGCKAKEQCLRSCARAGPGYRYIHVWSRANMAWHARKRRIESNYTFTRPLVECARGVPAVSNVDARRSLRSHGIHMLNQSKLCCTWVDQALATAPLDSPSWACLSHSSRHNLCASNSHPVISKTAWASHRA